MPDVQETALPGVGTRYDFTAASGRRLSVLVHRSGRRQLMAADSDDPDECRELLELDPEDARVLAELLGGSQVSERTVAMQQVAGLAIDWIAVPPGSPVSGRSLRELALRSSTGVSVVAVLRDDDTVPSPAPEMVFTPGDTLVVVGTREGITAAHELVARR